MLQSSLDSAYQLAKSKARVSQDVGKQWYDKRVFGTSLEVGDPVLVRITALVGTSKLANKWQEEVYVVLRRGIRPEIVTSVDISNVDNVNDHTG